MKFPALISPSSDLIRSDAVESIKFKSIAIDKASFSASLFNVKGKLCKYPERRMLYLSKPENKDEATHTVNDLLLEGFEF